MTFFGKPLGNPDAIGGLFPRREVYPFRSRAGAALVVGSVVAMDLAASATEVDATDSNTGIPGADDNTIWNTVVDPVAAHLSGATPTLFGVVTESGGIADNSIGKCLVFGRVDQARVLCSGTISNLVYGTPLTVTTTNSFNATIAATDRVVGFYAGVAQTATNVAVIGPVLVHQGVGYNSGNVDITVA